MTRSKSTVWIALACTLPFVGLLLLHARHYLPFFSDDALISLRYASRLLDGHGLTWTEGRPVEGYSNLLWLLLVALLGLFRVDLVDAARVLGCLGIAVVMFSLAYWYSSTNRLRVAWFPITFGLLFLSLGAPVAVWAIGGLEQPLFSALVAVSIPLLWSLAESEQPAPGRLLGLSFVLGLVCLTRPDGPLVAVAAAASLVLVSRSHRSLSRLLAVLALPLLFSLGQLAFRLVYYGELVPNTALVKIAFSLRRSREGLSYLLQAFTALQPLSGAAIASLVALALSARSRARSVYLLVLLLSWSAYVAAIGGDLFPAYRHMLPLMVVGAFALAEIARVVVIRLLPRPAYLYPVIVLAYALFVPYTQHQFADKHNQRAVKERWEWQGREVGLLLKAAFGRQQPLMAVTAAGCLPYWSELPALDMLGLNDYYLPRHPPKDFGAGWVGHELGNGRYVLDRRPDIIVFTVGSEPAFRSGAELSQMTEFHEWYSPISVRTHPGEYLATVYFNKYSRRIGIVRRESTITVPGFLFTGERVEAYLNTANRLVVQATKDRPVRVTFDSEPGIDTWLVEVRSNDAESIASELRRNGSTVSLTLRSTSEKPVEIDDVVLRARSPAR